MAIFFCMFAVLCLSSVRIFAGKEGNIDYLSLGHTQTVKGIFIILVFFSHFHSYVTYTARWDLAYRELVSMFGQTMVTMFLFYSGFGIMESIRHKGQCYVNAMPKKRVLATLLRFDCAVLLFAVLALWQGKKLTPLQFLLSLIGWDSLGNSNWYIFTILMLYLITYGAFKLFRNQKLAVLMIFLVESAGICYLAFWNVKPVYWYDTALCYVLGMVYSLYRNRIEERLSGNRVVYVTVLLILALVCGFFHRYIDTVAGSILCNCAFAVMMLILTMRVSFQSKILNWCGRHLFSLYILQRIPMILLKQLGLVAVSIPIYFLCCVAGTLLLLFPFEFITEKLWQRLKTGKSFS